MWETIKTPAYVVDEKKLRENLECLHRVEEETGCHILLAQKAFISADRVVLKWYDRQRSL